MFLEQLERERFVALRERAVAHHVGNHESRQLALFGVEIGLAGIEARRGRALK
jgi:hypothetical protein